jgi:hypothetical protein
MRQAKKQLVIDYQSVFGTPEGRRVLEDLKKRAPMVTGAVSTKGGVDVNQLLIETGRADVIKTIYRILKLDPMAEREPIAQD